MEDAAALMQGEHDFGGLADHRVSRCLRRYGSTYTIRKIEGIKVVRQGDEVLIWITGKSFLRQQIRNMVAVLYMVGVGGVDPGGNRFFSIQRIRTW